MTESANKRAIQKLQRVLVDALEDVKAKDIQVFDTEHLTPLFERVLVATATSNRQTRALAASVRDALRENGYDKPRVEGEDNGEWVIADCGDAVVHIMQAEIRDYYRLEEIWGDKPVRLRLNKVSSGFAKSEVERAATKPARKSAAAGEGKPAAKAPAKKAAPRKSPAAKAPAKTASKAVAKAPSRTPSQTAVKKAAVKKAAGQASTKAAPAKKAAAKKPAAKKAPKT